MTPCIFSCTWLLPFVVLATLSTGELEFYQDAMPETSENLALKELARYIEAQGHQRAHRAHLSTLFSSRVANKHNLEPERQNERDILQAFAEKSGIADMVRESSFNAWIRQAQRPYYESTNQIPREYDFGGYYGMSSMPRTIGEYINMKMPLPGDNGASMKERPDDYRQISAMGSPYNDGGVDQGMREETISDFRNRHAKTKGDEEISGPGMNMMRLPASAPEFTFKFNDAKVNEVHPFAVKPNDPRFYQDAPPSIGSDESDRQKASRSASEEGEEDQIKEESDVLQKNTDAENVIFHKLKDITTVPVPELDQQPGHHPLIVPVNHSLNNDIYFIAIVAGCSAAVMFALVLISLTWCRLQRGVKAAADIEYPAYGVTGPNKDVSPSGDQRLAQSAQMYHFQHQKQQIIAMENRTSATRDPGSVSEAESDEENEEGDYTVYECPGLASTGEMEVKNPLFHDDPTPATPAQTNTDEDHI